MAVRHEAIRLDEIRSAAERVAASHGLDVVDIEFAGGARDRILRVYLEKNAAERARLKAALAHGAGEQPEKTAEGATGGRLGGDRRSGRDSMSAIDQFSGVTHEDCAAFSRDFGVLLDVEDLVPGDAYTLEASSPGLDRKLSRPEDFWRFVGCLVNIQTFEPVRNNRHWQGRLTAVTGSEAGSTIALDLSAVRQNSKSRKTGASQVEIALGNIEKAHLVPEI
jgi:ribosome maturation factor RimP